MSRALRSAVLSLLILAVVVVPAVAGVHHQAKARSAPKAAAAETPTSSLWSALVALFAHSGGTMDPDGATATKPGVAMTTQPPADSGGQMDPNG